MDGLVSVNVNRGIAFLIQTAAGILGNSSVFYFFSFTCITAQIVRPSDLILTQLVLWLFSPKGIPQTMAAFGLKSFLDEAGGKLVFYLHRVARGVSLSTTCLLSGFQTMKLHRSISGKVELQIGSPEFILFSCFICWILHLVLNINIAKYVTVPTNSKNISTKNI